MTQYTSINPNVGGKEDSGGRSGEFRALVNVKSSRYVKLEFSPDSQIAPRIGIQWVMGTTKGNTFDRTWSIGVPYEGNETAISADGKKCSAPIKRNSNAYYMLEKVVAGGFPAERLTDDVSVFDGETFYMDTDANPRVNGGKRDLYPKQYHPEGWEAASAESKRRREERESKQNAPAYTPSTNSTATLQGSYTPPGVSNDVLKSASDALVDILLKNGSTITRNDIPAKLSTYVVTNNKSWDDKFRKEVTYALWDMNQLTAVVSSNPTLKLDGETISFR